MKRIYLILPSLLLLASCAIKREKITMKTLLDEMTSWEAQAQYPAIPYRALQTSSYDRTSVSPSAPGWFANNDGFGIERTDTIDGRVEHVLFDQKGPGAITRIWLTTLDKRGTLRFYFDRDDTPEWAIPAYDMMQCGFPEAEGALLLPHTSYTPDEKGGNTFFLPIPFARNCKITWEDEPGVNPTPKYYHINYRLYADGTPMETFSLSKAKANREKIAESAEAIRIHRLPDGLTRHHSTAVLAPGDSLSLHLPDGQQSVYELTIKADNNNAGYYAQLMRKLILTASFDGQQTVWVPLSDFSGGGMGAPEVESYFLSADGHGSVTSRWLMPYSESGQITMRNTSADTVAITAEAATAPLAWTDKSLYFHASWRQERSLPLSSHYDDNELCRDWNFATINGRGIYKGDVLTLYNHTPAWYGEGDEKIWVDNDIFPSHFGTGTEDYYNSSWAPVVPFHTPYGGAPRADLDSSKGYNTFFRTRNLDAIPFHHRLRFDIELLSWADGNVDYATTIYWYGDASSRATGTSGMEEASVPLLPTPPNPATFHREEAIEFETLTPSRVSPGLRHDSQNMLVFPDGIWSGATHLLCTGGKPGDFIEFTFDMPDDSARDIIINATKANDYGTLTFAINGIDTGVTLDGYNEKVVNSGPVKLGRFTPHNGKIILSITLIGTNPQSTGEKYYFALDDIQFFKVD